MTKATKFCFGWYADGEGLNICNRCRIKKECKTEWEKTGGQVGKIFDKEKEKEKL